MLARALILSTLISPSLALAAGTNVGPTGLRPLRADAAPAALPLADLKSLLQQLVAVGSPAQLSVTDAMAQALTAARDASSSSLLHR